MKTISIFSVCIFLPFLILAQGNSSFDLVGGIDYSFRQLSSDSEEQIVEVILDQREREEAKVNWRAGFNYNQQLTTKTFLKSGVRLASVGYRDQKLTGLMWGSEHDGTGGWTPDPSLPHEIQLSFNYLFVEIPIAFRYELGDKKVSPFVEAGIAPMVYMTTNTKRVTDIDVNNSFTRNTQDDFNKLHLAGTMSLGINYKLNDKLQIFGQAVGRYHFTKLYDAPIAEHLYNYGLEFGLRCLLNKE